MYSIGNDELDKRQDAKKDALCPNCNEFHIIQWGKSGGKETKDIGFVKCINSKSYLVAVAGKLIGVLS